MSVRPSCDICGARSHADYEDGIIECRDRLVEQRDEWEDLAGELRVQAATPSDWERAISVQTCRAERAEADLTEMRRVAANATLRADVAEERLALALATNKELNRLAAAAPAMAKLLLRAVGDAESDAILLPGGQTVCEWVEQVEALLRQAGAM